MSRRNHKLRLLHGTMALMAGAYVFGVHGTARADTVRYDFCHGTNCADGYAPTADLIKRGSVLYGTTGAGGIGYGTVFSVTPSGTYTVLHSFGSIANDALSAYAGVTRIGNTLYGTTVSGGQHSGGAVYSVRTNGTGYTVLHSFCSLTGCADGEAPFGSLIDVGGTLYGTTTYGGTGIASCSGGCGTVFEIQPNGSGFQLLHSFCSLASCADGAAPAARMLDVSGVLFGTTTQGGTYDYGTVFSVVPCGSPPCAEAAIYSFGTHTPDGQDPVGGLTYKIVGSVGYLYGTTAAGGSSSNGTVFAVTTSGAETWLYSFAGGPADGSVSNADLLARGAYLYGTTTYGGTSGYGTVFKIKANGLAPETVINAFSNSPDGAWPSAGLVRMGGALYGTTEWGGGVSGGCSGCGTVFSIP